MKNNLEYARLSGISIPDQLLADADEARAKLSAVKDKKTELESREAQLAREIPEFAKREAAALIDGGDGSSGKLAIKRGKAEKSIVSTKKLLEELKTIEKQAQTGVEEAATALQGFIDDALAAGRSEMKQQLDSAMAERGRQLGGMRPGEIIRSTPPEKSSASRIAVCESCQADIAIIKEDIVQPVTDASFEKLPRFDHLPFMPGQARQYFLCPYCGKTPWREDDKILTNAGYKIIPETKEIKEND